MKILQHSELQQALIEAGLLDSIKKLPDLGLKAKKAIATELKSQIHHVADNMKITKASVVTAFNEPKMSNMLEACGYSFATLYGAMHMAHKVAEQGALHVIAHFAEHTALHKLAHNSSHKVKAVDDFIDKYPVMKKVTGPALAGLMLYGYTLTEPHKLGDWDMTNIKKAFTGEFSVHEFMHTSEALQLGTHVATGKALSLSALAENATTLAMGLTCTAIQQSSNPKLQELSKTIQKASAKFFSKTSPLDDIQKHKNFTGEQALKSVVKFDPKDGAEPKDHQTETKKKSEKKRSTEPDWWHKMSKKTQQQYLKNHPNSTYELTGS